MDAIVALDSEHDLVYSPDDDGWYIQRGDETSQVFDDRDDALQALLHDALVWE